MSGRPLLIELGCDELPAGACEAAIEQAPGLVERLLAERRLPATAVRAHVAPRRIAVVAEGVARTQRSETVAHRGPPERVAFDEDGAPTAAGAGFARRHGLTAEQLGRRDGFVWASVEAEAGPASAVLGGVVEGLVTGLAFPRNMRWGTQTLRFARAIRWIVALHGDAVVDVELAGVRSGRVTRGHRFLDGRVELAAAEGYLDALRAARVVADHDERRALIAGRLAELEGVSDPGGVLREVQHLAEWPSVHVGGFPERFLELPERVLVAVMQSHQRYFPLADGSGRLRPAFAYVSNGAQEAAATITAGNERVLRGRLDDAAFSFERDLARGIEELAVQLPRITYHARAGSLADRTARIEALVAGLAAELAAAGGEHALAAARLCKADQASLLVAEFAELEGYAGEVYARHAGLPDEVCRAIGEHYRPDQAGGALPDGEAGALVALADKLDALATAFALGERPTGSRDPYGLRRAAAGVSAIALARAWALRLEPPAARAREMLEAQGADVAGDPAETVAEVAAFVLDRVDAALEGEGVPVDLVRCARGALPDGPLQHALLARALAAAVDSDDFARVHAAHTRCARLAARGAGEAAARLDPAAFEHDAERSLADALAREGAAVAAALARLDPAAGLRAAAELAGPIDAFFDAVLVMHDDSRVRANRLRLLVDAAATLGRLGDFSEVQR